MKKLIVNADDFGYSEEINKGIIESHLNGIVTSTSMIVNMPGFKSAVKLAKKHTSLDIGIHLNLTEGTACTSSTLSPKGKFSTRYTSFILKNYSKEEIEAELEAQIKKLETAGIKISHIDAHEHVHVSSLVFDVIVSLAKKYKIMFIRVPDEKFALDGLFLKSIFNFQLVRKLILSFFSFSKKKILKENGL